MELGLHLPQIGDTGRIAHGLLPRPQFTDDELVDCAAEIFQAYGSQQ